ncbi:MAG: 3-oxoacyl-ACP reductase FabG [Proteobacteria bacterium]|nr:3-oxoacyl-ACP reductase FabG [Pseudomonadota bacterium]
MQINLNSKVVLVTGGTRGIGRAIAVACASAGAKVFATFLSSEASARQFEGDMKKAGLDVECVKMDVRDTQSVQTAIRSIEEKTQNISVLVNNAGIVKDGLLLGMEDQDWADVINANLTGNFRVTREVAKMMVRSRKGSIVNISSVSASKPGRGQSNYASSKGGVEAMTKALAVEFAPKNIRVNSVAPGVIVTDMSQEVRDAAGEKILETVLMKRFGTPEDIAHAVLFLASDLSSYITGEVLHVDGGLKF